MLYENYSLILFMRNMYYLKPYKVVLKYYNLVVYVIDYLIKTLTTLPRNLFMLLI